MFGAPEGSAVDEPQLCEGPSSWDSGGYIRVHGSGTRRLVLGRAAFERACPGVEVEHAHCEAAVLIDALGRAVIEQLREENALGAQRFGGIGMGVCGEVTDPLDYDAFHPSISVFDWRDAELAVRAIHSTMADWNLGGHFGVSVRGMACVYTTDPRLRDLAHEPVFGSEVRFDGEP